MKQKPVIISDVDSVMLDWVGGFSDFLETKGICNEHLKDFIGKTIFLSIPELTNTDCKDTNRAIFKDFSKSNALKELKAFQTDSVQHVKELADDFDFVALTCISKESRIQRFRKENLVNVYGDIFKDIICIGSGKSKELYIKELAENNKVATFIDDRQEHIIESINAGIQPILFTRGVEKTICDNNTFHTMDCWGDIKQHLQSKLILDEKLKIQTEQNNPIIGKKLKF